MKKIFTHLLVVFSLVLFTACGGGAGGDTAKDTAITKITQFAQSGGDAPTVQDYIDAGVTGVTEDNLKAINDVVEDLEEQDVDTSEEIQALVARLGVDITVPIITLTGANPQTIELGSAYIELNATTDDGSTVEINSTAVDTSTLGSYTVTYNATDGTNQAIQVTRTVSVVDTTAPVFTSDDNASVVENQKSAITLVATDDTTVTYSISDGNATSFDIDSATGVVTFKVKPDYESGNISYSFTATATDTSSNEATQSVTITILNDNCTGGDEIWHLGTQYCAVESNITDKVWLDRNLGATMECNQSRDSFGSPDDAAVDAVYADSQKDCFGDYYQWGRNYDGHEDSNSSYNDIQQTDVNDTDGNFTKSSNSYNYDWAEDADADGSLRSANWSTTDGDSVCPIGYRVPTKAELEAETTVVGVANRNDAYNSFLRLPPSGYRSSSASMTRVGSWGLVWTSSVDGTNSNALRFHSSGAELLKTRRANGQSVRCLRD